MKRTMIMLMMALIVSGLTGKLSAQEENKEIRIKLKVEDAGNGEVIILDTSLIGDEQGTRVHTLRNIRIDKGEGEMRFEVEALIDSVLETLEWTELPEGSSEEREGHRPEIGQGRSIDHNDQEAQGIADEDGRG